MRKIDMDIHGIRGQKTEVGSNGQSNLTSDVRLPVSHFDSNGPFQIAVGAFVFLYIIFLNPYFDVWGHNAHDPAAYISRALSLLEGHGYGEQFANAFFPVTLQPPMTSLLLTPVLAAFGVNFFAIKLYWLLMMIPFCFVAFKFFAYFLAESGNREISAAAFATILFAGSPVIFGVAHRVMAEIPLFTFMMLAIMFTDKALKWKSNYRMPESKVNSKVLNGSNGSFPALGHSHIVSDLELRDSSLRGKDSQNRSLIFLAALFMATAYYFKVSALTIPIGMWAMILHPDYRRATVLKRMLAISAILALFLLPWMLWKQTVPDIWYWTHSSGIDFFLQNPIDPSSPLISAGEFFLRLRHNIVWGLSNNIAVIFLAPLYFLEGSAAGFLISIPVVLVLLSGWIVSCRKWSSVLEGFVLVSLTVLLLKHLGGASRYVAMTHCGMIVYGIRMASHCPPALRNIAAVAILFLTFLSTSLMAYEKHRNPYGRPVIADYVAISSQARQLLPQNATCYGPMVSHWQVLTGHSCFTGDLEDSFTAELSKPDYFVILNDSFKEPPAKFKNFEGDLVEPAAALRDLIRERNIAVQTVTENNTFRIVRRAGGTAV